MRLAEAIGKPNVVKTDYEQNEALLPAIEAGCYIVAMRQTHDLAREQRSGINMSAYASQVKGALYPGYVPATPDCTASLGESSFIVQAKRVLYPGYFLTAANWIARQSERDCAISICTSPTLSNTTRWELPFAENSTVKKKQIKEFESEVWNLFEGAKDETFEDGMESRFSRELFTVIREKGSDAVSVIADFIISGHANPEVASEALRWIGRINHAPSYYNRIWLLESCLNCNSPRIRDGAILGLASMDDPDAIPYIQNAMKREFIVELREDMKQLLDQLEKTFGVIRTSAGEKKSVV